MKKILLTAILMASLLTGCDSLRFTPSESQKQNAWLHNRTAIIAAQTARTENASEKLQQLSALSELQSRAFSSYYGLPSQFMPAATADDVLVQSSFNLAQTALNQSIDRPDGWQLADSALELGIGLCALIGGVYGTRAIRFLKTAKIKSDALKEIITGNELFKKDNADHATAFKQAHKSQTSQTRQIVAQMKA